MASHGHGKIHFIDTSRNVPFEQGSESMVNSGKEENKTRQDIDDKILQQPKAGVCDVMENIRNMDSLRVIQSESGNGLRTIDSKQRDASESIMAQSVDDLKVIAPGDGLDSTAFKQVFFIQPFMRRVLFFLKLTSFGQMYTDQFQLLQMNISSSRCKGTVMGCHLF